MRAFLKRRWILLSCAVVLMLCSCVSLVWLVGKGRSYRFGVKEGFLYARYEIPEVYPSDFPVDSLPACHFYLHPPQFGDTIEFDLDFGIGRWGYYINVSLWFPLSVIVGLLVIRELRWREERIRFAEAIAP